MLDLTGIDTAERPELKHLVAQSARSIENALALSQPHSLLVRLNWPGRTLGDESDGLLCLDADGWVTAANPTARQMVSQLRQPGRGAVLHCSELFAMPWELLFDCAQRHDATGGAAVVGPALNALPQAPGQALPPPRATPATPSPCRSRTWRPSSSARRCRTRAATSCRPPAPGHQPRHGVPQAGHATRLDGPLNCSLALPASTVT
jgi:hypothetical protein